MWDEGGDKVASFGTFAIADIVGGCSNFAEMTGTNTSNTVGVDEDYTIGVRDDCTAGNQCQDSPYGKIYATVSWSNTGGVDCSDDTAESHGTEGSAFSFNCDMDVDITVGYVNTDHSVLDGTRHNGVTAGVVGISGSAYDLDGSDDYVNADVLASAMAEGTGSISMWFNVDDLDNGQRLFEFGDGSGEFLASNSNNL
jgi:hypothetical protein